MKKKNGLADIFTPYGTMGRQKYIFTLAVTTLLAMALVSISSIIFRAENGFSDISIKEIVIFICSPFIYISFVAVIRRCRDIGISPWWTAITLIPGLNIFIGIFLLIKGSNKTSSNTDEVLIQGNSLTNFNTSSVLAPGKQSDEAGSIGSKIAFGLIAASLITIAIFYASGNFRSSFDKLFFQDEKYQNESLKPFAFYTSEPISCKIEKRSLSDGVTLDEVKKKSESGDSVARLTYLSYLLYGDKPDFNTAHILLKNRANSGDYGATVELSRLYLCGYSLEKNTAKAIAYLETLGNPGYLDLAKIYEFGQGVEVDLEKAFHYRIKRAEVAMYKMDAAEMLFNGRGVQRDKERSFFLLKNSIEAFAKEGINFAVFDEKFNLGLMYYNGDGTEKNFNAAKSIFIEILKGRERVDDLRVIQVSERILAELEAQK